MKAIHSETNQPLQDEPRPSRSRHGVGRWIWRIVIGNPFYPISALLLLWGIGRLSTDPQFLSGESAKLLFNFAALQSYEILAVGLALLLARRRIMYDAWLLVGLENALVLVPLMLVMQAVLITDRLAAMLSLVGGLLILLRMAALRGFFRAFLLPTRVWVTGAMLLAFNLALPFQYRGMADMLVDHREDISTLIRTWILPGLALLGLAILPARQVPQRALDAFPLVIFNFWLVGSVVAWRGAEYVNSLPFALHLLAPFMWAWAWMMRVNLEALWPAGGFRLRQGLSLLPLAAAFTAAGEETGRLLPILVTGTALGCGWMAWRQRCRWEWHLALASAALAISVLPQDMIRPWVPRLDQVRWALMALGLFLLGQSCLSRHRLASVVAGMGSLLVTSPWGPAATVGLSWGFAGFLIHSLAWIPNAKDSSNWIRRWVGFAWLNQTLWLFPDAHLLDVGGPSGLALLLLAAYVGWSWGQGRWMDASLPGTSVAVLLAGPLRQAARLVQTAPDGMMSVVGSFLLLAAGTLLALGRKRWWGEKEPF